MNTPPIAYPYGPGIFEAKSPNYPRDLDALLVNLELWSNAPPIAFPTWPITYPVVGFESDPKPIVIFPGPLILFISAYVGIEVIFVLY
nr:MAG TPA: hypothetical protein [Caudoviricetes sp.]